MKVRCISNEYSDFTKEKIYEVFIDDGIYPCIIDDAGNEYIISGDSHLFEVVKQENLETSQKTLRDEFAMAAISGILSELHCCGDSFDELHKREVRRAYKIADTMMKLRN